MTRESMSFDVVIVGGGPAGLAAAIRLGQLAEKAQKTLNICLIDKGAHIGAHLLSGAVLEPRILDELLPSWQTSAQFAHTPVVHDQFVYLTKNRAWHLPTPLPMRNHGNFIISIDQFSQFLKHEAEQLGINIFADFAATEILYADDQRVIGVITGDKGLDKNAKPKAQYQPGLALYAKQVIFAEGCRGSLSEILIEKYALRTHDHQTYALGIKEVWEMPSDQHLPGHAMHTIGWPLEQHTYGGSFLYQFANNLLSIGLVLGLDYQNPYLNPYEEFQRFKTHAFIANFLKNGKRIAYGARCLVEGGIQSLPTLSFPGGLIIGDAAGFLNVAKIKGIHTAMQSGMIAAESLFAMLSKENIVECKAYSENIKISSLWRELYRVRNIRPAFRFGLWPGLIYAAIDTYLLRGHTPWTFHHSKPDHLQLKKSKVVKKIIYPKHDNILSFDLTHSVYLANITYTENQPCHLKLKNNEIAISVNLQEYAFPEGRYCPAGVYEIINTENNLVEKTAPRLQLNAGNCIHCKACDIKDPTQNITWTPPEGGSGPQYEVM